ncbi:hypothetical protein SAMN04487783_1449 [Agrococcus baldri]|uniref:Uncharacterized protein n=1 Tax=Agrococcus baldri TaxID=153730 RepID=A0AA94KZR2_9MICO|nr:hypothetical protein [Agrococcus baldri]SFS10704.1 hypothetical protein SAMN04487783_1449 [Agrococcus baldri]
MTMTDAAAAAAQAAAAAAQLEAAQAAARRASAVAEAHDAIRAVQRAVRALEDAAELVVLRGQEGWLGPARDAFDARGERARSRVLAEVDQLRLLALAIEGAL